MFKNDGIEYSEDDVERGTMKADGVWSDAWWPVCDSRGVDRGGKGDKVLGASGVGAGKKVADGAVKNL